MEISLIIPCYHKHFKFLDKTLDSYLKNTIIPEQVIISLNGCKFIDNNNIMNLQNKYQKEFNNFIIIKTDKQINSAIARNLAIPYVKHDIISFSDADDIYHTQRIEIIKYFFENYDIKCLLHGYILSGCNKSNKSNHCFLCENNKNKNFIKYDKTKINFCNSENVYKLNFFDEKIEPGVKTIIAITNNKQILPTHGLASFKKEVFDKLEFNPKYNRGQDSLFCQEVLKMFKKTIVIDAELIIYNNGWIPKIKDFKLLNDIYLNLGSPNPPPPGKPRPIYEYEYINQALKLLNY